MRKIIGLFLMMPIFSFVVAAFTTHHPTEEQAFAAVMGSAMVWLGFIGVYLFIKGDE